MNPTQQLHLVLLKITDLLSHSLYSLLQLRILSPQKHEFTLLRLHNLLRYSLLPRSGQRLVKRPRYSGIGSSRLVFAQTHPTNMLIISVWIILKHQK